VNKIRPAVVPPPAIMYTPTGAGLPDTQFKSVLAAVSSAICGSYKRHKKLVRDTLHKHGPLLSCMDQEQRDTLMESIEGQGVTYREVDRVLSCYSVVPRYIGLAPALVDNSAVSVLWWNNLPKRVKQDALADKLVRVKRANSWVQKKFSDLTPKDVRQVFDVGDGSKGYLPVRTQHTAPRARKSVYMQPAGPVSVNEDDPNKFLIEVTSKGKREVVAMSEHEMKYTLGQARVLTGRNAVDWDAVEKELRDLIATWRASRSKHKAVLATCADEVEKILDGNV